MGVFSALVTVDSAIFFNGIDSWTVYGVVRRFGFAILQLPTNAGNNLTDAIIVEVEKKTVNGSSSFLLTFNCQGTTNAIWTLNHSSMFCLLVLKMAERSWYWSTSPYTGHFFKFLENAAFISDISGWKIIFKRYVICNELYFRSGKRTSSIIYLICAISKPWNYVDW